MNHCVNCNAPLMRSRQKKYCSRKCASAFAWKQMDPMDHRAYRRDLHARHGRTTYSATCVVCGKVFDSVESDARYCSTGVDSCCARHQSRDGLTRTERLMAARWDFTRSPTGRQTAAYKRLLRGDPCAYCGQPGEVLDHIEPRGHGGEDGLSNLTAACRKCNARKGYVPLLLHLGWLRARDDWSPWDQTIKGICTYRRGPGHGRTRSGHGTQMALNGEG